MQRQRHNNKHKTNLRSSRQRDYNRLQKLYCMSSNTARNHAININDYTATDGKGKQL